MITTAQNTIVCSVVVLLKLTYFPYGLRYESVS